MSKIAHPLTSASTIVIIGGGPAGASCAIKLRNVSQERGIKPRIVLYEGKSMEKKSYYNQCLGVLSPPLDKIMNEDLEIPFPRHLVQKEITGYYVHSEKNTLRLQGEHEPSFACRRVEFDNYLFQSVKELGVEVIQARVTDLDFLSNGVMVYSECNNIKADKVIGAFGLDENMAKVFERLTPYRLPRFLYSIVTKFHLGDKAIADFGNYIHAFLPSSLQSIEFGAITPKGNHLSLNISGRKLNAELMDQFLVLPSVKRSIPSNFDEFLPCVSYFKGRFPTLPAKEPTGSRYIMIGDAAGFNRPFKGKGINSAILTGIRAAESIVHKGIGPESSTTYLESCQDLLADIPYGKILRFLTLRSSQFGLLDGLLETAKSEPPLLSVMFNIVSGQESYKKTWKSIRNPFLLARLLYKTVLNAIRGKTGKLG